MKNNQKKNKHTRRHAFKNQNTRSIRVPPNSLEAEQSMLGSLLLNNRHWDSIAEKITTQDFYHYRNQIIFNTIKVALNNNQAVDLIIIAEHLERKKLLKTIGGLSYLINIVRNTPNVANIDAYANIVFEYSLIRHLITTTDQISEKGYTSKYRTANDFLRFAERSMFAILEKHRKTQPGPKKISVILSKTLKYIEALYKNKNNTISGIDTGFIDLNEKTSGLQKSDLIIVASRPAMGKTTFAMNLCTQATNTQKKPIIIFSLEMPSDQIMMRLLSSLSKIDHTKIRTGRLNDLDWDHLASTVSVLIQKNLYIDDSSSLTPTELRIRAQRIARANHGLSLIMIDYLQLMHVPELSHNRILEIAEISRSLKSLAKEFNIPVIALSQLNRSLEQRPDKRPINSDLRESGSIEQDADLIMFIYRDEIYHAHSKQKGVAEIIIGKQRNGPTGVIKLIFQGQYARFDNLYKQYKKVRY